MAGELWRRSASELAGLIARGEISVIEAFDAHVARIAQVNPAINAVVCDRLEAARAEAQALDRERGSSRPRGTLHGVPITVKESLDVAGLPTTYGLPSRRGRIAERDDPWVARLRETGAIVLGKTNVSQLMLFYETDNPLYGRTDNPWNPSRTPGGSSGGQAAIVAAGGSPFGLGTDIGGSVRVPAAFCGLSSLKPTAGRYPDRSAPELFAGQTAIVSQVGVIAREVADLTLALEVLGRGGDEEAQVPPLRASYTVDLTGLRVGAYMQAGSFRPAPAVARAVDEAARTLSRMGATVVPFAPPDPDLSLALFLRILSADGGRGLLEMLGSNPRDRRVAELFGVASKPKIVIDWIARLLRAVGQNETAEMARNYGFTSGRDYWQAVAGQQAYRSQFRNLMDSAPVGPLDALIGPPCALPAMRHGSTRYLGTAGAYATMYNLLGYPAGVVPCTRVAPNEAVGRQRSRDHVAQAAYETEAGSEGLPIGVQIAARPWREDVVLAIMSALEGAARDRPDFPRTPVEPHDKRKAHR